MPAERLPMRRIKEIIRLSWGCGLSARQIFQEFEGSAEHCGGVFEEGEGDRAELASA